MESLAGVPAYRRDFGMVFQNYALFPIGASRRTSSFPEDAKGAQGRRRGMVADALELVRLPDYGARYPHQLSGGQQQRVALARALVFNPLVLLMDEPLGALDRKLREDMQLEIKRLQKQLNITTIYVTHDQEEALVLSDRIVVVNHGRFEQVADPATLYERPATTFVADFIGESNIVPLTSCATAVIGLGKAREASTWRYRPTLRSSTAHGPTWSCAREAAHRRRSACVGQRALRHRPRSGLRGRYDALRHRRR